jgi:hypothetical protein
MEAKLKHLEFIQGVINRHNSNSFMIKGWAITTSSALFAIAGAIKEPYVVLIAIVPIFMFWGLDAYFLSNERCFIDLFNARNKDKIKLPSSGIYKKDFNDNEPTNIETTISDFNMNFKLFKIWKDNLWLSVVKSKTILWFYLPMLVITIIITILLQIFVEKTPDTLKVDANIKSHKINLKLKTEPKVIINNIYPSDSINKNHKK